MITSEGWFIPTGYGLFNHITRRGLQNWEAMDDVSRESWEQRARGERSFIPSPNHHNREEATTVVLPMPAPQCPVKTIRPTDPYEKTDTGVAPLYLRVVPDAAKQMVKRLEKHGWKHDVRYCVGPWPMQTETEELEDGTVEKTKYGQAPSVVLRFRRGDQVGFAMWLAKPWTKDGDKMKFHTAQVRPDVGPIKSNELIKLVTAPVQGGN